MFAQLNPAEPKIQRRILMGSLAFHGLLFAWLLHTPEPQLLTASSVAVGRNGECSPRSISPPSRTTIAPQVHQTTQPRSIAISALVTRSWRGRQLPGRPSFPCRSPRSLHPKLKTIRRQQRSRSWAMERLQDFPTEVFQAAQSMAMRFVRLFPSRLPIPWSTRGNGRTPRAKRSSKSRSTKEGRSSARTVLQSLGPEIDEKCLAALDNWHFQPATHNGVPIPSKQDAIFPFKARG